MKSDLRTRLLEHPPLGSLTSVAWVTRPAKSSLPGITLQLVSPGRSYTLSGATSLRDAIVRADIWGLNIREIDPVSRALTALLEQPEVVNQTVFGRATLESERDMPPEDVEGVGTVYRISADYRIWWKPNA